MSKYATHPKPIQKVFIYILTILTLFASIVISPTFQVHAADGVSVDVTGRDFKGPSGSRSGGVSYARTGYLCYLVQKDGGLIDGMTAKAFKCQNYNGLGGEEWRLKSKKGGYGTEIRSWTGGEAPWKVPPFNEDKTTNSGQIENWMKQKDGDKLNAVKFVENTWKNPDWTEAFHTGEYVLVLENILSYAPGKTRSLEKSDITSGKYELMIELTVSLGNGVKYHYQQYAHTPYRVTESSIQHQYDDYNMKHGTNIKPVNLTVTTASVNTLIKNALDKEIQRAIDDPENKIKEVVAPPVIGTLSECIAYEKAQPGADRSVFAGYTNKVACFSEYIGVGGAGERAGFKPWTSSTSNKISDGDVTAYGVGMMIISAKDGGTEIKTYWEPNGSPGDPEPATNENNKKGKANIVKTYRIKKQDGSYEHVTTTYETDVTNTIQILDEPEFKVVQWDISDITDTTITSVPYNPPGNITDTGTIPVKVQLKLDKNQNCLYVLLEKPEGDGIDTYDKKLNKVPGPAPDTPNKTAPPQLSIVKNYRTKDSTGAIISDDGCFIRRNVVPNISISDEPEYKVVGWKVSTDTQENIDSITWNPPGTISKNGTTSGHTTLEEDKKEFCLYVLLERTDASTQPYNYILPQSRITRRIWLSDPENPLPEKIQEHEFIWSIAEHSPSSCSGHYCTQHSCNGHTTYTGHDSSCNYNQNGTCTRSHSKTDYCSNGCKDKNHTEYCSDWRYIDRYLNLSLYNIKKMDYGDIVSTKKHWTEGTGELNTVSGLMKGYVNNGPFNRGSNASDPSQQEYKKTNWDYICVIHRGQDALTLLEYKNQNLGASAANTELKDVSSSSYKVSNTDSGTRQLKVYYDKFSVELVNDTTTPGYDLQTTFGATTPAPHTGAKCGYTTREAVLTTPLTLNDIGVKVDVYSGSQTGGVDNATTGLPTKTTYSVSYKGTNNNKTRGLIVQSGGSISFRPYIQMQYDTILNIDKKAYVIGEYQRSITTNDYAEVGYDSSRGGQLKLSSLQWSTHKSSSGKRVLPGGAALSLSIPDSEQRYVRATTYQCILDSNSAGAEQLNKIGGTSTLQDSASALNAHKDFVQSVAKGLDNINMQQWVSRSGGNPFNGIPVDNTNNTDISSLRNNAKNGQVSMDSKYYFSPDGTNSPAGEGDLDVEIIAEDATLIYTFFTNTKGEVRVVLNDANAPLTNENAGTLLCVINANDTEWEKGDKFTGGSDLTADAKCINKRTQIVDKLIQAVEAGTGYDTGIPGKVNAPSWRSPNWYNEAFDGLSVAVNSSVIKVGFKDPSERQTILDPKLIPLQTSQSNMNTDSSFTSGYKTQSYSTAYSQNNVIGKFKSSDIDLADMDTFFSTRDEYFHIPNQTTQDLH